MLNKQDIDAGWSSLVARWAHNPKVVSSNLAPATKIERVWEPKASKPFLILASIYSNLSKASCPVIQSDRYYSFGRDVYEK